MIVWPSPDGCLQSRMKAGIAISPRRTCEIAGRLGGRLGERSHRPRAPPLRAPRHERGATTTAVAAPLPPRPLTHTRVQRWRRARARAACGGAVRCGAAWRGHRVEQRRPLRDERHVVVLAQRRHRVLVRVELVACARLLAPRLCRPLRAVRPHVHLARASAKLIISIVCDDIFYL